MKNPDPTLRSTTQNPSESYRITPLLLRDSLVEARQSTCLSLFTLRTVRHVIRNGDEKNSSKHVSEAYWQEIREQEDSRCHVCSVHDAEWNDKAVGNRVL